MKITKDHAVQMHYRLTSADGTVIDTTAGRDPLAYLHGHGHVVPGVEKALDGRIAGDSFRVVVNPEDAYGERDPSLDVMVPLSIFPETSRGSLIPGARFRGPHPSIPDQSVVFSVIRVEDDQLLCSANHPLAGITLNFDIQVLDVRPGTKGEIADGQIHAPDCSTGCC